MESVNTTSEKAQIDSSNILSSTSSSGHLYESLITTTDENLVVSKYDVPETMDITPLYSTNNTAISMNIVDNSHETLWNQNVPLLNTNIYGFYSPYSSFSTSSSDASYEYLNTATYSNIFPYDVFKTMDNSINIAAVNPPIDFINNRNHNMPLVDTHFEGFYPKSEYAAVNDQFNMNENNQENKMGVGEIANIDYAIPDWPIGNYQPADGEDFPSRKPLKRIKHNTTPYEKYDQKRTEKDHVINQKKQNTTIEFPPNITVEEANQMLDNLIDNLDTNDIAMKIKHWLKVTARGRVNMTSFSNNILNRAQGTLSTLLNNPKPWEILQTGQWIYVRMYNWLQLTEDQKDQIMKLNLQSDKHRETSGENAKKVKKIRRLFTIEQISFLKKSFAQNENPKPAEMKLMAVKLELKYETIRNYFYNTRSRSKKCD